MLTQAGGRKPAAEMEGDVRERRLKERQREGRDLSTVARQGEGG